MKVCIIIVSHAIKNSQICYFQDLEAAVRVLPLKSLSKRLYPVEDHPTHPPVFRLGYRMAEGWAKEYAQRKRIPSDFRSVIEYINSNCGAESFIVRFGRIHQLPCMEESNQYYWFLSICTNYRESDADLPSEQDMKRLQKFLNEPELPAWYLDRDERRWGKKKLWHRY